MDFPRQKDKELMFLICMRERRIERKGGKATLFLCLTVPQVGFV